MSGHNWSKVSESEVRVTLEGRQTSKKQWLWVCSRCSSGTIIDDGKDPEQLPELYGLVPLELDGTTIMNPLIMSCDEELERAKT